MRCTQHAVPPRLRGGTAHVAQGWADRQGVWRMRTGAETKPVFLADTGGVSFLKKVNVCKSRVGRVCARAKVGYLGYSNANRSALRSLACLQHGAFSVFAPLSYEHGGIGSVGVAATDNVVKGLTMEIKIEFIKVTYLWLNFSSCSEIGDRKVRKVSVFHHQNFKCIVDMVS